MLTAEKIIKMFNMKPLTGEGGYYTETYRSDVKIPPSVLPDCYKTGRNISTTILYLLTPKSCSKLHRIKTDEIFHFYLGDPVRILQLFSDGGVREITLGSDIERGQQVQTIIPKNTWQGSYLLKNGRFALLGTTVSPGFEFQDFQRPRNPQELIQKFPQQKDLIIKLT